MRNTKGYTGVMAEVYRSQIAQRQMCVLGGGGGGIKKAVMIFLKNGISALKGNKKIKGYVCDVKRGVE